MGVVPAYNRTRRAGVSDGLGPRGARWPRGPRSKAKGRGKGGGGKWVGGVLSCALAPQPKFEIARCRLRGPGESGGAVFRLSGAKRRLCPEIWFSNGGRCVFSTRERRREERDTVLYGFTVTDS